MIVNDLDDEPGIDAAREIEAAGGRAAAVNGDVTGEAFGERIVDGALETFGGLHIIVNNAGYIWNTALHNNVDEQWQAMLDVHATAPFRILRAAGRYFRDQVKAERAEGENICRKVVNISSVSGLFGAATQASYSAGKMAVVGLTKSLAKEWGRLNITVNAVAFGPIATRLTQVTDDTEGTIEVKGRRYKVGFSGEMAEAIAQSVPLGRFGTPAEAAGAVYLLCTPESDYVSGQILVCAGGDGSR